MTLPTAFRVLSDQEAPRVRAECARIARRLRASGARVFGLVPIDDQTAVPPVGVQLGVALMHLSGATVAYVDANTHLPALQPATLELRPEEQEDRSPFLTRWIQQSFALLLPRARAQPGETAKLLERVLFDGIELFQYVLVDLTGFDVVGELEAALRSVDQLILVGRAGHTRENDVLRRRDELQDERVLGVLLVG
jgi:hypothetical protein